MKLALSEQQRSLVKNLLKGMTLTEASLKAGYSENCPAQSGFQALQIIKKKMPQILENSGLSREILVSKYLKPMLSANNKVFATSFGEFTDERSVPAWQARKDALDMAFKLGGDYSSDEVGSDRARMTVVFDIPRPKRNDADSRDT